MPADAPTLVPLAELAEILARDAALREALLRYALRHTRHPQDAEDLFGDTLEAALDGKHAPWDRARHATAGAYLGSMMNGLARNRRRGAYDRTRAELDEQNPPPVASPAATPEGVLLLAGRERKRADIEAALRARLADKPLALAVLDWTAQHVEGNLALAEKMQCTVAQVVAAKQMIREKLAAIVAERASDPGPA